MADTNTTALAGLVKTAYDRYVEFALRSQPLVRSVADKRPAQQGVLSIANPSTLSRTFSYYGYFSTFVAKSSFIQGIVIA